MKSEAVAFTTSAARTTVLFFWPWSKITSVGILLRSFFTSSVDCENSTTAFTGFGEHEDNIVIIEFGLLILVKTRQPEKGLWAAGLGCHKYFSAHAPNLSNLQRQAVSVPVVKLPYVVLRIDAQ